MRNRFRQQRGCAGNFGILQIHMAGQAPDGKAIAAHCDSRSSAIRRMTSSSGRNQTQIHRGHRSGRPEHFACPVRNEQLKAFKRWLAGIVKAGLSWRDFQPHLACFLEITALAGKGQFVYERLFLMTRLSD